MAIAGGLISIGQHFSHNFFMCIWVLLSEWFEYTYISSWDVNKKIKVVVLHLQSLWKTGLALWAFGDVGSDIYLTYTTYKPVGNLLFKSVNFCALFLILRHAKRPLCVMKSTIILWEALIPQSVRMSPFLLYPQIWKVTLVISISFGGLSEIPRRNQSALIRWIWFRAESSSMRFLWLLHRVSDRSLWSVETLNQIIGTLKGK